MSTYIIPIPVICDGKIMQLQTEDRNAFLVNIYSSPKGPISPIYVSVSHTPAMVNSFKVDDHVKLMVFFNWNTGTNDYEDVVLNAEHILIGLAQPEQIIDLEVKNPNSNIPAARKFIDEATGAGLVITEGGAVINTINSYVFSMLKPGGSGINENTDKSNAQNFHRILVGGNNISREHFGMYSGKDDFDKATKVSPTDTYITHRRFVQQSLGLDNWVSTCEGNWMPWIGANNDIETMKSSRNVLYTKIINNGENRITIEAGEAKGLFSAPGPGINGFYTFRIDNIKLGESYLPTGNGAAPAVSGNIFACKISEEGEVEVEAGNTGLPAGNTPAFKMTISKDGEMVVQAKKKITLTYGDADENSNSITLDQTKGIDVNCTNGLRFNGKPLITSEFIDFLTNHKADLIQTVAPGSPAPMGPLASIDFVAGSKTPGKFLTDDKGAPATGIIASLIDLLKSVG